MKLSRSFLLILIFLIPFSASAKGKVVADVGAGSGMLAFLLAKYAKTVYAIEPVTSFRNFIREKANKEQCSNNPEGRVPRAVPVGE